METATTVLTAILDVFLAVGQWISEATLALIPMFYADGALTFLGVLAVAGLAISVSLLLINIISNFLHFRA